MFTKRPDKYTTGLINLRNDCFANSSIQAYSALPGLTDYLNKFIVNFKQFEQWCKIYGVDINTVTSTSGNNDGDSTGSAGSNSNTNPKFLKLESEFSIPLHKALAKIIKKLQSTQLTSKTISVWTFLHELEIIFNAKISRSQHDAHELTQLINETLENENLKVKKKYDILIDKYERGLDLTGRLESAGGAPDETSNITNDSSGISETTKVSDTSNTKKAFTSLSAIDLPEFPLNGLILNQMKCLNCHGVSKPNFSPFLMLTLHTPTTISTNLDTLLNENESESIEGYQCLKCRIKTICQTENYLSQHKPDLVAKYSQEEKKTIKQLTEYNNDPHFSINEDLSPELEEYIKSYSKNGLDINKITSTVLRKNQILKPPKIFGLHLSRSSFNGVNVVRNQCRVSFRDHLTLNIGKEYHEDLKHFKLASSRLNASKVLTTDVDDMEDEAVQVDDEAAEAEAEAKASDKLNTREDDDDEVEDDEVEGEDDSDDDSIITATVNQPSTSGIPDSLNNSPITSDQSDNLHQLFKSFKFNENDNYKYKLKAMIRHHGSHTQGHYECYKRKPLFVKDSEGMIIKLSPEILDEVIEDTVPAKSSRSGSDALSSDTDTVDTEVDNKSRSNSKGKHDDRGDIIASMNEDNIPEPGSFRRKFSNIMGRRPSVLQADPESIRIQEIMSSGLNTPAELVVHDINQDYFQSSNSGNESFENQLKSKLNNLESEQVKLRKIPSLLKSPYWRISDSLISEVSRGAVLVETTSVYMLYYERVDKS